MIPQTLNSNMRVSVMETNHRPDDKGPGFPFRVCLEGRRVYSACDYPQSVYFQSSLKTLVCLLREDVNRAPVLRFWDLPWASHASLGSYCPTWAQLSLSQPLPLSNILLFFNLYFFLSSLGEER